MIWKLHEEDLSVDEIAQQLSQIYGMAKDEFIPDIIQALDAWQAMGLLGDDFIPLADEADDMLGYMQAVKLSTRYRCKKLWNILYAGTSTIASAIFGNVISMVFAHACSVGNTCCCS